ncbi:hypothetical protein [Streptomyces sp. NPDC059649]|uniref:hypothetical protein n=1 Tax=Streptomyces sp. NPDC059649 TaxID=3346895 RepID=UPI0036842FB6
MSFGCPRVGGEAGAVEVAGGASASAYRSVTGAVAGTASERLYWWVRDGLG